MRAAFGVAIGIAAVDALLSAFTAVTILALIIVSPQLEEGGSLARNTVILEVDKTPSSGSQEMPVELLLDVQGGPDAPVHALMSSARTVLAANNAPELFQATGEARWEDRQCVTAPCSSLLMLTAPRGTWALRLRVAGVRPLTAAMPAQFTVRIRKMGEGSIAGCERTLTPIGQMIFTAHFSSAGAVTLQCSP